MAHSARAEVTRRNTLKAAAVLTVAATAGACARNESTVFEDAPEWMTLLGVSEKGARDYKPRIEGEIPTSLKGSLYRNGPGLFERGGVAIKHLLDGDGLVQRLSFSDGGVRYQNRFVRTAKYNKEQKSGLREYSTWTTRKSSNPFDNIGGGITHSQAGITVYPVHGKIIARDEVGPSYEIDAETLETLPPIPTGRHIEGVGFKAHSKIDPETGEWIVAGAKFGRHMQIYAATYEPNLKHKVQFHFEAPRQVYFHDFFASRNYLIFLLHPCYVSPFPFLAGLKSFTDSLSWRRTEGNLIAVVRRSGGTPKFFEAPGSFMWHALNAFEQSDEIVIDFVGYDEPDHFLGDNALFLNIMQGRMGHAAVPGKIRRNRINLNNGRIAEEILDEGNHEFPVIDGRTAMARHRVGYFASGGLGAFNSGIKRVDFERGVTDEFDFGSNVHVGEPVFAERAGGAEDDGWILTQCLDGETKKTFFAIFDAGTLVHGPISKVWLEHHVPISFHGSWLAADTNL